MALERMTVERIHLFLIIRSWKTFDSFAVMTVICRPALKAFIFLSQILPRLDSSKLRPYRPKLKLQSTLHNAGKFHLIKWVCYTGIESNRVHSFEVIAQFALGAYRI